MASAFSGHLDSIYGGVGGGTKAKILGTTKGVTMKFLPDVSRHESNKKIFNLFGL